MMTKKRVRELWVFAAPAAAAAGCSLWPLEYTALVLACTLLCIGTCLALLCVRSRCQLLAGIFSLAFTVSVAGSQWPLRAAYAFSQAAFERVGQQIRAGEPPHTPALVGCFVIHRAEIHPNGRLCLWTDDDPNGATGFVQAPPDNLRFNLWSHIVLDDSWQFICED